MDGRASAGRRQASGSHAGQSRQGPATNTSACGKPARKAARSKDEHPFVEVGRRRFSLNQQRAAVSGEQLPRIVRRRRTGRALRARVVPGAAKAAFLAHPGRRQDLRWLDRGGADEPQIQCRRAHPIEGAGVEGGQSRGRAAAYHQRGVFGVQPFSQQDGSQNREPGRGQTFSGPRPGVRAPLIRVDQHMQVEQGTLGRAAARPVGPEVVNEQETVVGERGCGHPEKRR